MENNLFATVDARTIREAATNLSHALSRFTSTEYGLKANTLLVGGDTLHVATTAYGHVFVTITNAQGIVIWETACFEVTDETDPVYAHLIKIIKARMDMV
jgi:hypothetical protein